MSAKPSPNSFLPMTTKVGGFFNLERRKRHSGLVTGRWDFHNNITDTGLNLMATATSYAYGFGYYTNACCVGTGNAAPADSDTALISQVASVGATDGTDGGGTKTYVAGPPAYWQMVRTYQFGTGVAAGNLAEIGIYCSQVGSTQLFCRELIRDGGGAPTTITVEADEILIVTYTLRFYLDTSDYAGTITIGSTDYDYTRRMYDIDTPPSLERAMHQNSDSNAVTVYAGNGTLASLTGTPSGSSVSRSMAFAAYVSDTHHVDVSTTFTVSQANYSPGVSLIWVISFFHKYQFYFPTAIPKVLGQQMSVSMRLSWDRYAS